MRAVINQQSCINYTHLQTFTYINELGSINENYNLWISPWLNPWATLCITIQAIMNIMYFQQFWIDEICLTPFPQVLLKLLQLIYNRAANNKDTDKLLMLISKFLSSLRLQYISDCFLAFLVIWCQPSNYSQTPN